MTPINDPHVCLRACRRVCDDVQQRRWFAITWRGRREERARQAFQLIFGARSGEIAHTHGRVWLSLARHWLALWSVHLSSAAEQQHGLQVRFHSTLTVNSDPHQ